MNKNEWIRMNQKIVSGINTKEYQSAEARYINNRISEIINRLDNSKRNKSKDVSNIIGDYAVLEAILFKIFKMSDGLHGSYKGFSKNQMMGSLIDINSLLSETVIPMFIKNKGKAFKKYQHDPNGLNDKDGYFNEDYGEDN